ncbi:MAG: hypothetical protein ACOC3T_06140, partial [Bacteroidota bacterium]
MANRNEGSLRIKYLKVISLLFLSFIVFTLLTSCKNEKPLKVNQINGWTILSDNRENALKVIRASGEYDINHLQLSHKIVHKLKHLRQEENRKLTNELIDSAHAKGIDEVVLWDHALYWLGYYPDKFKTGPDSTLNLDNPELWEWIKNDYREMLDLAPNADGIVLTFIETGAHVEDQYSEKLTSEAEKLALLVNEISKVIIDERNLKFYIRTFIYFPSELNAVLECLDLIENKSIIVMSKEVPHDFFLTHPRTFWIDRINFPVIVEFDCTHEYNGQGVVSSIFPQVHLNRWKNYQTMPNVKGYVARTDRYEQSTIIGRPSEINLFALARAVEDSLIRAEEVFESYIFKEYGEQAIPYLKPAFENAYNVVTSVWYTLGLPLNSHSRMTFDNVWSYTGMVSGRWMDEPVTTIEHNVNKQFHYWKDLVNHLASPEIKSNKGYLGREILWDKIENGWFDTTEQMDMEYLNYIIKEKDYGVGLAQKSLNNIVKADEVIEDSLKYKILYHTFKRTELSARLYRGVAKAYFGYRVYSRAKEYQTEELHEIIKSGMEEGRKVAELIKNYPVNEPSASYKWRQDAEIAMEYINMIAYKLKQ